MCSNIKTIIYCFIDLLYIGNRYVMVTYYVTLFVSLLLNYMPHHIFCLGVMHVTTYVTPTISSLSHIKSAQTYCRPERVVCKDKLHITKRHGDHTRKMHGSL
jgi:hypothetical protein